MLCCERLGWTSFRPFLCEIDGFGSALSKVDTPQNIRVFIYLKYFQIKKQPQITGLFGFIGFVEFFGLHGSIGGVDRPERPKHRQAPLQPNKVPLGRWRQRPIRRMTHCVIAPLCCNALYLSSLFFSISSWPARLRQNRKLTLPIGSDGLTWMRSAPSLATLDGFPLLGAFAGAKLSFMV